MPETLRLKLYFRRKNLLEQLKTLRLLQIFGFHLKLSSHRVGGASFFVF